MRILAPSSIGRSHEAPLVGTRPNRLTGEFIAPHQQFRLQPPKTVSTFGLGQYLTNERPARKRHRDAIVITSRVPRIPSFAFAWCRPFHDDPAHGLNAPNRPTPAFRRWTGSGRARGSPSLDFGVCVVACAAIVARTCLAGCPLAPGLMSRNVFDQVTGSVAGAPAGAAWRYE